MADLTPAATVILLREPPEGGGAPASSARRGGGIHSPALFEVYLVRRHQKSGFMADAFVFPGGKVDPGETLEQAACRELREEASVDVACEDLVPWAHWITPSVEPRRFAAKFFLARMPQGQTAVHDTHETTEELWITPHEAVERQSRGELKLPPPTLRNLDELARYDSLDALFAAARTREVVTILPKFVPQPDGSLAIVLPWDAEYASLPGEGVEVPPEHAFRSTPSRIVLREGRWWNR